MTDMAWRWTIGEDADAIHSLLCVSDAHAASDTSPAPKRSRDSTRAYVDARAVHVLWAGDEMAAAITLIWRPPFSRDLTAFPPAVNPAYITRLSVAPEWFARDSLIGARCIRHAAEVAARDGADVVRSEANPHLASMQLLQLCGFVECARGDDEGRPWSLLYKPLAAMKRSSAP